MKMLVIDDSKPMRTFLTYLAGQMAFKTSEASDGREALDLLVKNDPREPFDVALVDWDMPRMNGLQLVQALRRNPDFSRLKLMMVTTQNSHDHVAQALQAGANDFLMKPVTQEMLAEKLQILGLLE
jgi:two-component system chemotaxis response regulator CheY